MAQETTEPKVDSAVATNGQASPGDNQQQSHYQFPSAKALEEAGNLPIKDENGKEILLNSLYKDQPDRQLVIFIRHFFCGHCEEYVRYLSKHLSPSTLATTTPPTILTIIGCGEPICIPDYRIRTGCPFPIYTDRPRAIYEKLDMVCNLGGQAAPEYLTTSITSSVFSSMKNIVTSGSKGLQGGKYSQNGGEWVFEGGELQWVRRMRDSADHTLIKELRDVLGMGDAV